MRPADKLKLWTGGYINMPGLSPPGVLKLVQIVCFLCLFGCLIYGVLTILGHFGGDTATLRRRLLEATVFFVFPFVMIFTISVNSPISRYVFMVFGATAFFYVYDLGIRTWQPMHVSVALIILAFFVLVVGWMFMSRRGRTFYLLIGHERVPPELEPCIDSLMSQGVLERLAQRAWSAVEPYSPIVVIVLAIMIVYAAFANMKMPL
ncbi:MAG: hypothetical protein R3358_06710 [Woeseiaceae bacterium]|nr:hypothetical protein [Woeseiaceae bacterium]